MAYTWNLPNCDATRYYQFEIGTRNRVSFYIWMLHYDDSRGNDVHCLIFAQLYLFFVYVQLHRQHSCMPFIHDLNSVRTHTHPFTCTYIYRPIVTFDNNCILYFVFTQSDKIVTISTQYIHPTLFPGWRIIASNMILISSYPSINNAAVHHRIETEIRVSFFLYMILYHNCCLIVVALSIWLGNILPHRQYISNKHHTDTRRLSHTYTFTNSYLWTYCDTSLCMPILILPY